MSAHRTRDEGIAAILALASGVSKHLSGWASIYLDGTSFTPAALEKRLNELAQVRRAVEERRADLETALETERNQMPEEIALVGALVGLVRSSLGNVPNVLVDFGIQPKKARTALTVDQKAAAIAKNEATRQARHTVGPKQKAKIHGDVTGVTVTPITAPATGAASPTPAATPATTAPHTGAATPQP